MRLHRNTLFLVMAAAVIRLALASWMPLLPDETYYWDWSRHLAAGYFDHPPAVALLIRAGTLLFGATPVGVRFWTVISGAVATLALSRISWSLAPAEERDAAAMRTALFMLVIPASLAGFVLATPDAPLLAAITLAMAAVCRALECAPRSQASLGWWCAAGIATGAGLCSKYTAVLVPAAIFIALLLRRDLRPRLAEPGPYAATIMALLIFAPVVLWNSHHHWISFAFQIHHGLGEARGSAMGRELSLIGAQLGLISPVIAGLAAMVVWRAARFASDARAFVLAVVAIFVLAFFMYSATRRPVEPNWPFLAFMASIPLLASASLGASARRWLNGGVAFAAFCSLLVALQAATSIVPIAPKRDPLARAHGWEDLANAVVAVQHSARSCAATWIAADRYQEASELAFHLPGRPRVFSLNLGGRRNQYDLWPTLYQVARAGDCAVIVVDDGTSGATVATKFGAGSVELLSTAEMRWRGSVMSRRGIWLAHDLPALPPFDIVLTTDMQAMLDRRAAAFEISSAQLDSTEHLYRGGPSPVVVQRDSTPALGNADRPAAISRRLDVIHALLTRLSASAVYRDTRYPNCTFVRVETANLLEDGYVFAPEGCNLNGRVADAHIAFRKLGKSWFAYIGPFSPDPQ